MFAHCCSADCLHWVVKRKVIEIVIKNCILIRLLLQLKKSDLYLYKLCLNCNSNQCLEHHHLVRGVLSKSSLPRGFKYHTENKTHAACKPDWLNSNETYVHPKQNTYISLNSLRHHAYNIYNTKRSASSKCIDWWKFRYKKQRNQLWSRVWQVW